MKIIMIKKRRIFLVVIVVIFLFLWVMSWDFSGENLELKYGASFSRFHADELKLEWRPVYLGILDDLGVRRLRFSAHWPLTEPKEGKYNFTELDFQFREAEKRDAKIVLAVGRRLPGWPECHTPEWVKKLPIEQQKERVE